MSLSDFVAQSQTVPSANDPLMLDQLTGESIKAAFHDGTSIVIVLESGPALVVSGPQSFWLDGSEAARERASQHAETLSRAHADIARRIERLSGV